MLDEDNTYGFLFCAKPNCKSRWNEEVTHSCYTHGLVLCQNCASLHSLKCSEVKEIVRG